MNMISGISVIYTSVSIWFVVHQDLFTMLNCKLKIALEITLFWCYTCRLVYMPHEFGYHASLIPRLSRPTMCTMFCSASAYYWGEQPHTSVTALHINLYVYVCLIGPTKLNEHFYDIWWRLDAFGHVHFSSAWEQEWSVKYWCEGDQDLAQLKSEACMVTYYIMINNAGCSDHNDRRYARWLRSLQ